MATLLKDGRYQARKRVGDKRILAYGATASEAEENLRFKLLLDQRRKQTSKKPTMGEFVSLVWVDTIKPLAPLSQKRYLGTYDKFMRGLAPEELVTIDVQRVRRWLNGMQGRYPEQSIRYAFSVLRTILQQAWREGYIPENPCSKIRVPRRAKTRERILEVDQAIQLLDQVKETEMSLPIYLATVLGLRRGEIAGLKWKDFDRVKNELRIVRQRQAVRPLGVIERDLKSESSRRTLYVTGGMIAEIDARGNLDSEYLATFNGLPWVPDTITEKWGQMRVSLGLGDWHFHDLRHGAAGLLMAAGCDILTVAAVLGHRKPDMSLSYLAVSQGRRQDASHRLDALLGSRNST